MKVQYDPEKHGLGAIVKTSSGIVGEVLYVDTGPGPHDEALSATIRSFMDDSELRIDVGLLTMYLQEEKEEG